MYWQEFGDMVHDAGVMIQYIVIYHDSVSKDIAFFPSISNKKAACFIWILTHVNVWVNIIVSGSLEVEEPNRCLTAAN